MSEATIQNTSLTEYLAQQLGREVIAEFCCGTDAPVRKAGVLTAVQPGYLVLRDDMNLRDTLCATESLCFITFYLSGTLPRETSGAEAGQATARMGGGMAMQQNGRQAAVKAAFNHTQQKGQRRD